MWGAHHHPEKEFCSYLQYLEYLSQNRPPPSAYELFAKGYEDYLQSPLQVGGEGGRPGGFEAGKGHWVVGEGHCGLDGVLGGRQGVSWSWGGGPST